MLKNVIIRKGEYETLAPEYKAKYRKLPCGVYELSPEYMEIDMKRLPIRMTASQYDKFKDTVGQFYRKTKYGLESNVFTNTVDMYILDFNKAVIHTTYKPDDASIRVAAPARVPVAGIKVPPPGRWVDDKFGIRKRNIIV